RPRRRGRSGRRARRRRRHDVAQPGDRGRARAPRTRSSRVNPLTIIPVAGIGAIRPGDEIAVAVAEAAEAQGTPLATNDCLVVTQKIVSKAEGRLPPLDPLDREARRRLVAAGWATSVG